MILAPIIGVLASHNIELHVAVFDQDAQSAGGYSPASAPDPFVSGKRRNARVWFKLHPTVMALISSGTAVGVEEAPSLCYCCGLWWHIMVPHFEPPTEFSSEKSGG